MSSSEFIALASSLAAGAFTILIAVLGWLGNKIYSKLDDVTSSMNNMKDDLTTSIGGIKDELHDRITGIDKRVTRVETIVDRTFPHA
jgi:predicted PurR-regulated permease PerM